MRISHWHWGWVASAARRLPPAAGGSPAGFITPQLAGVLVVLLALSSLTAWALWERSARLKCEVARVQLYDAYQVLADKVKQQNDAVNGLARAGDAAKAKGRAALNEANVEAAKRQVEIDYWRQQAAKPTPVAAGCTDAWTQIRQALQGVKP